ncbi:hypothetical protein Ahy_A03g011363 isoform C [Arachis hypogaea]|uniref:Uncharacterized protein n=1 Tax=Arachis hypogaea TaxID=3818 RepID=A0A445DQH1_ARAHY|nr:hypothetical protein Ahy_A03g011363 isoform C [Arachis hypogaea]
MDLVNGFVFECNWVQSTASPISRATLHILCQIILSLTLSLHQSSPSGSTFHFLLQVNSAHISLNFSILLALDYPSHAPVL